MRTDLQKESDWEQVKAAIKGRIALHSYRMWIEPLAFRGVRGGELVLACPNPFSRRRVLEHYRSLISGEISRMTGNGGRFSIEVGSSDPPVPLPGPSPDQLPLPGVNGKLHGGRMLRRDFTFEHFVVGGNNDFAYSAALSLASKRSFHQNALFLLSKTGLGKSHLSQAIGRHILEVDADENVYYITAEDFTSEMVHAFRYDQIADFKKKYRDSCDVLLLEDVHYLSGKERTQVELALMLDTLFEANKKIIFSSCYLPADIPKLNDKLRSRLTCGLISSIEPPNYRTRVRILKKKAALNGYHMPEDVYQYLASELTEDVRQLESGLIGVTAKSSLLEVPVDLPLAESVVKHIIHQRKAITVDAVKKLVCRYYGVSVADVVSRSRKHCFVRPRQIAMYLARRYTDAPLQTISKSFNRYHATALHSINVVERAMKSDTAVRRQVDYLCRKLDAGNF